jgi:hypothetical protein
MWEEILKAIPIYLLSALKVVFGPTLGYAAQLHIITSMIVTFMGMMTSVVVITFFGGLLRNGILKNWFLRQEEKAKTSRFAKYGLVGLAILTPLLLTPILGTILTVAGGYPRRKIILYMAITGALYAIFFTWAVYEFGRSFIPELLIKY